MEAQIDQCEFFFYILWWCTLIYIYIYISLFHRNAVSVLHYNVSLTMSITDVSIAKWNLDNSSSQVGDVNAGSSVEGSYSLYSCQVCQKPFKRNYELRRHMQTHAGKKSYRCSICFMHLSRADKLKEHMARHNSKNQNADSNAVSIKTEGGSVILSSLTEYVWPKLHWLFILLTLFKFWNKKYT